jgi:two-component system sensor histidine kinase KdpD
VFRYNTPKISSKRGLSYVVAVAGIALATCVLAPFRASINSTTVALSLLLVVLFVATIWGSRPALVASLLGMFSFNFFFLPPYGTLTIADPENWIALTAFLLTAITAGQLSARAKRRAEEAEAGRQEIERLYRELQGAFERASHAEAIKRSEKLKSALLDAVSHDIRTPLTSIKASVTTLLDEVRDSPNEGPPVAIDTDSRREMLEVIDEESDRLNQFIENMIEMARIEAGDIRLRRRWGSVDEIVGMALDRSKQLIKDFTVNLELEKDLPVARVDARAVSEVVYTLIDNAVKYSPPHTTITISAIQNSDETIEIVVQDEGPGIALAARERVFEKFFRVASDGDHGPVGPRIGSGMGLSIARGIVEAHGGRIWIDEPNLHNGTRVVFTLPIGDDDEEPRKRDVEDIDNAVVRKTT